MRKTIITLAIFCIIGCVENRDFSGVLTKDYEKSFWMQWERNPGGTFSNTNNQWVFYSDGRALPLVSYKENEKGTPVFSGMESDNHCKWSFLSTDSTLRICDGGGYKVLKFHQDTVLMKQLVSKGKTFLLVRKRG